MKRRMLGAFGILEERREKGKSLPGVGQKIVRADGEAAISGLPS
jgi:hypothetical protein